MLNLISRIWIFFSSVFNSKLFISLSYFGEKFSGEENIVKNTESSLVSYFNKLIRLLKNHRKYLLKLRNNREQQHLWINANQLVKRSYGRNNHCHVLNDVCWLGSLIDDFQVRTMTSLFKHLVPGITFSTNSSFFSFIVSDTFCAIRAWTLENNYFKISLFWNPVILAT